MYASLAVHENGDKGMRAGNRRFCCFLFVLLLSAYALVSRCVVTWLVTKLTCSGTSILCDALIILPCFSAWALPHPVTDFEAFLHDDPQLKIVTCNQAQNLQSFGTQGALSSE